METAVYVHFVLAVASLHQRMDSLGPRRQVVLLGGRRRPLHWRNLADEIDRTNQNSEQKSCVALSRGPGR